jgi:hypothetical protein
MRAMITALEASGVRVALLLGAFAIAAGCGSSSPSSPSTMTPPPASGPPETTVTLTASGASPRNAVVPRGGSVLFVNNSGRARTMASDPHPIHDDCPAMNSVGVLLNGQSRATGAFTQSRACGFHDHEDPENSAFHGTIDVQ